MLLLLSLSQGFAVTSWNNESGKLLSLHPYLSLYVLLPWISPQHHRPLLDITCGEWPRAFLLGYHLLFPFSYRCFCHLSHKILLLYLMVSWLPPPFLSHALFPLLLAVVIIIASIIGVGVFRNYFLWSDGGGWWSFVNRSSLFFLALNLVTLFLTA